MARCGCTSSTCACAVQGSTGITVSGKGTATDPYLIGADSGHLSVRDTATVNLTLSGQGTSTSAYLLSADVIAKLDDLADVTAPAPTAGYVLAWDSATSQWRAVPPVTAAPGAINSGNGLSGDGSAASPLVARPNLAGGIVVDGNGIGIQSGILNAITQATTDTGWATTGYVKGADAATISGFLARNIGQFTCISVSGTLATAIPASASGDYANLALCTVPSQFRPAHTMALAPNATGPNFGFAIGTSGVLTLSSGPPAHAFPVNQIWSVSGVYVRG